MRVGSGIQPIDIHAHSLLASVYSAPDEVLSNPVLSSSEKRCILAAWASDAFAVEDSPWLRQLPNAAEPIPIGDIMKALRSLDDDETDDPPPTGSPALARSLDQEAMQLSAA